MGALTFSFISAFMAVPFRPNKLTQSHLVVNDTFSPLNRRWI
jgi:hypothetical protein